MNATDVYNIAKALPEEELLRLCGMLKIDIQPEKEIKKEKVLPNFTVEDGIRHLLKSHFNKIRTP